MGKEKLKFALETKKGQTVYEINLNIRNQADKYNTCSFYKDGLFVKEHKIALQTIRKIALNDEYVTLFDRLKEGDKKQADHQVLEHIIVCIKTQELYFPNGIFCTVYTLQNPEKTIKQIKRKIINKINNQYGFLRTIDVEQVVDEMQIIKQ